MDSSPALSFHNLCGHSHVDTAEYYKNEAGVGKAVRDSGLKRDEVFISMSPLIHRMKSVLY